MELLASVLDFIIGFLTFRVGKESWKQNHKRGHILSFAHYAVLFIIFLVILFVIYG